MNSNHLLLYLALETNGRWHEMYSIVKNKKKPTIPQEEIEKIAENFKEKYVGLLDPEFPKLLKRCTDGTMPFVIFYRGDIELLKSTKRKVAVIGSRKSSQYGESRTRDIVKGLKDDIIIVSGFAKGIDTVGIKAALDTGKKVIAVLGCAIDEVYPKENAELFKRVVDEGGVLVSEYPPGVKLDPDNFRWRNRIVASLSDVIFVGEAYKHSGCSITVGFALNYGKSICCLPYPSGIESFNNQLIREGATLVEESQDIENLLD